MALDSTCYVSRLYSEIRFPPSVKFFDKKTKILQSLMLNYPEFEVNNIDILQMHTKEIPGIDIKLMPNRLIVNYEKYSNEKDFITACQEVWGAIYKILEINIVERVGIRGEFVKEMNEKESFDKISQFLNLKRIQQGLSAAEITLTFKEMERNIKVSAKTGLHHSMFVNAGTQSSKTIKGMILDVDFNCSNIASNAVIGLYQIGIETIGKYLNIFE